MRDTNSIELLKDFETDKWISWLKSLLANARIEPNVIFGDMTFDRKVLWIKNELESRGYKTDKLSTAIFSLFSEVITNKSNTEDIYYFIQLLAVFKNQEFAAELETIFLRKELAEYSYHGIDLNTLLLNTLFNFRSINDLADFFNNILHTNEKSIYYLLGLKYYCKTKEVHEYFFYLNCIAKKFLRSKENKIIGEGIVNSLNELSFLGKGRGEIFQWWTSNANKFKQEDFVFFDTIRCKIGQWLNDKNKKVLEDLNLLNLKTFNDSLSKLNAEVFIKYTDKIPTIEIPETTLFENCLVALENYVVQPDVNVWDLISRNAKIFTINQEGEKKFSRDAWVFQKTCTAIARNYSNRVSLSKKQRKSLKDELISE